MGDTLDAQYSQNLADFLQDEAHGSAIDVGDPTSLTDTLGGPSFGDDAPPLVGRDSSLALMDPNTPFSQDLTRPRIKGAVRRVRGCIL